MRKPLEVLFVKKIDLDVSLSGPTFQRRLEGLAARGHQVSLLTTYAQEPPSLRSLVENVFICIPSTPILRSLVFLIKTWMFLLPLIAAQRLDAVVLDKHTFFLAFPWDLLGRLGLLRRTRILVDFRDDITERSGSKFRNLAAKFLNVLGPTYAAVMTSGICSTSRGIYHKSLVKPRAYAVVPSGMDPAVFEPEKAAHTPSPIKFEYRLRLIYIGYLGETRGLLSLIEALSLTRNNEISLTLVGRGELRDKIVENVRKHGLAHRVDVVDFVPQDRIPSFIAHCDVGILPYDDVPMWKIASPLKLIEFLAMGKPAIIRGLDAFEEYLEGLPHIYRLEDNQPATIAKMLDTIYELGSELPDFIPEHRQKALEHFTWGANVDIYETFLNEVLRR